MLKEILITFISIAVSFVFVMFLTAGWGWLTKKYSKPKRYERLVLCRAKGWDLIEGLAEFDNTGWAIKGTYITRSGEQVVLILEREIDEDDEDKNK